MDKDLEQYIADLISTKDTDGLTWDDIANIVCRRKGFDRSESFYRRFYKKHRLTLSNDVVEDPSGIGVMLSQLRKERVKIADEKNQLRAYIRKQARDEAVLGAIKEAVPSIISQPFVVTTSKESDKRVNEGILLLSDWHLGIEIESPWNVYNKDVAKQRLQALVARVIEKARHDRVRKIHVFNLADLIAGRIHLTIRLESRNDVISQIMEASELIAQILYTLSREFEIEYYDCIDNHSRLEPKKDDALDEESLCRIVPWYLKQRLANVPINFNDNAFGLDIITAEVLGYKIAGVHGDKDKQSKVVDSISLMTESHYDLICTAHLHHFSTDEKNRTILVSNGSLMGTDSFARKSRLSAFPSQTFITISKENFIEGIYRIVVG